MHVLTGPDHLSAIATLSANVDSAGAFILGIRWGIGHSTGLLLVGCIFIALSMGNQDTNVQVPERVSHAFEGLVGIFMLLLGTYGLRKTWDKRPSTSCLFYYHPAVATTVTTNSNDDDDIWRDEITTYKCQEFSDEDDADDDDEEACREDKLRRDDILLQWEASSSAQNNNSTQHNNNNGVDASGTENDENSSETDGDAVVADSIFVRCVKALSLRTMATVAGIVHGLAGPGGVLGVIPAVQLHSARLATIYLGSFCASSTLTMGIFAMLYGTCSSKIVGSRSGGAGAGGAPSHQHREFLIEGMSASLSILVGLLWLSLLTLGKLDDVFP